MQIKVLKTIHAPSALGDAPAFEGDVLDVSDETASSLIDDGYAAINADAPKDEKAADDKKAKKSS